MSAASECHTVRSAPPVLDGVLMLDDLGEHRVTALSASLLRAVMATYGEDHHGFAARAGLPARTVAEATDGICPAWALPYDEFTAIADAVADLWPCGAFETAAACDLLLSSILNGEQCMATDVLTEPGSTDLAWELLTLAISSRPSNGSGEAQDALFPEAVLELFSERVAALANSQSPDAWVGVELLVTCLGGRS